MLYIEKKAEPLALTQAKQNGLQCYDDMTTNVKDVIRKQLAEEQGYLCAYCMRRMRLETMQIEHYVAQHPTDGDYDPALTIDYSNMLGVCPGNKGENLPGKFLTCDQHRENQPLTVDPRNADSVALVLYMANGEIYSKHPAVNEDLQNTLNLNCKEVYLPQNRKAALDTLKGKIYKECKNRPGTKAYFRRLYTSLRSKDNLDEYLGILLNYLQKRINSAAT